MKYLDGGGKQQVKTIVVRLLPLFFLTLLAVPAFMIHGCGGETTSSNGFCGGCPSDSIPQAGSTVLIRSGLSSTYNVTLNSADPTLTASFCVNNVTFEFIDKDSVTPLNDICGETFSNGFIKMSQPPGGCDSGIYLGHYIRTRSDAGGTIAVDFATSPQSCNTLGLIPGAGATRDVTYFVQVSSCTLAATTSTTVTYTCP